MRPVMEIIAAAFSSWSSAFVSVVIFVFSHAASCFGTRYRSAAAVSTPGQIVRTHVVEHLWGEKEKQ